jgi:predicted PurR-regulated permease PerM
LEDYGITKQSLNTYSEMGREKAMEWVKEQGYNITEIRELVSQYSQSNSTQLVSELKSLDYLALKDTLQDKIDMSSVQNTVVGFGELLFGTGAGVLSMLGTIIGPILGFVNNLLDVVVFVGAALFFVDSDESLVDLMFQLLPVTKSHQKEISSTLVQHLSQVFVCSILLCVSHGFATWVYFSLLGMNFAYSAGFLVGMTTIFPFLSPWFVFVPALVITYLQGNPYTIYYGIGLVITEFALGSFVDDQIYELIPGSQPYITGLSIAFGVSTFGMSGVLIGPTLVVLLKSLFSLFTINLSATEEEENDEANAK